MSDRNGVQGVAGSNPAVPIGSKSSKASKILAVSRRRRENERAGCKACAVHRKLRALVVLNGGNAKLNRIRLVGPTTDGDGEP